WTVITEAIGISRTQGFRSQYGEACRVLVVHSISIPGPDASARVSTSRAGSRCQALARSRAPALRRAYLAGRRSEWRQRARPRSPDSGFPGQVGSVRDSPDSPEL